MEEKKVRINIDDEDFSINLAIDRAMYELNRDDKVKLEEFLQHYPNPTNDKNFMTTQDLVNPIKLNNLAYNTPTTQDEIDILKRQLKHCKSYVERQNIERRINKL